MVCLNVLLTTLVSPNTQLKCQTHLNAIKSEQPQITSITASHQCTNLHHQNPTTLGLWPKSTLNSCLKQVLDTPLTSVTLLMSTSSAAWSLNLPIYELRISLRVESEFSKNMTIKTFNPIFKLVCLVSVRIGGFYNKFYWFWYVQYL